MNLSEPFIKRPVMTTLIMVAVLFFGLVSYYQLPISNLPNVDYPTISVSVSYPGASPETMANTVASPLEKEFMTIPGMKSVVSSNVVGESTIVLLFDVKKSMDSASLDVQAALSRANSRLPPNLPNPPTYRKVNPAETPIMYIALASDTVPLSELYTYADSYIGQRLTMLDGVAQVITYGSPYAVRVRVDPGQLASRGITLEDVARTLSLGTPNLPTGRLDGPDRSATIVTEGQLLKAEAFAPLIVGYKKGAPIRISDLGVADNSVQNERFSSLYVNQDHGAPTVVIAIQKEPSGNTVAIADTIKQQLLLLEKQLPASITMHVIFNQAEFVKESILEVKFTLLLALFLVVLVVYFYLGKWVDTLIPSLVMPLSIIATFTAMYLLSYTLDNLSLLALTLAVGFIIDDAIVVLENIARHMEQGASRWQAALEGSKQISFTILSMTLSLVAVFIPLLLMPGLIGKVFEEFSMTLVVVTLASGFISLTFTPMLCSRFLSTRSSAGPTNGPLLRLYQHMLSWVLQHRKVGLSVGMLSFGGTLLLFSSLPTDFIPDDDIGFVIAYNQADQGTSSFKMVDYRDEVIAAIQNNPNIASFVSIAAYPQFREGINFITLKPRNERSPVQKVIQELYGSLGAVPGVNTFIKNVPLIDLSEGVATRGAYQYTLQSLHEKQLYPSAESLLAKMEDHPYFQGVSSDLEISTPQVNVEILRDQASSLGVSAEKVEQAFLLAYSGNRVSTIQTPLNQYDVILELQQPFQTKGENLSSLYIRSDLSDALIPLNAVAKWEPGVGPASINHWDQFPSVTLSFNLTPGIPLGVAVKELERLAKEVVHEGVRPSLQGTAQTFQEAINHSGVLLLLAIFSIYIVLGILYESFIHPLTILSTLPPALLGGLLTLYLMGMPLSLYAYLGLILLIGIVKKNGIMMVDYAIEYQRERGEKPEKAILDACLVRFRPIMMTTVATIAGALPIALAFGGGAEARRPLGLVIIGGLLFSQWITLFITPTLYLSFDRFRRS